MFPADKLSVNIWTRENQTERTFTSSPQTFIAPAGTRFVRVQSHSGGDLCVEVGDNGDIGAPATPNTGSLRVGSGGSEILQVAKGKIATLKIISATGSVTGAVVYGK